MLPPVNPRRFLLVLATAAAAAFISRYELPRLPQKRAAASPRASHRWEKLDGCELIASKWNDGDSFHVRHRGREHVFRLYFVDAPEAEGSFPKRVAQQAAYFGITSKAAQELGSEAAEFSRRRLQQRQFTVWTRWRDALGRGRTPRYYAIVEVSAEDLGQQLVANGLARIYGTRVPLPDGRDSRNYRAALKRLESEARRRRLGGWGMR
jgi:endonuclease YncB( thermonuclease family)